MPQPTHNLPALRAEAEAFLASTYAALVSLVRQVDGGIEAVAAYEGAARELAIVSQMEREAAQRT